MPLSEPRKVSLCPSCGGSSHPAADKCSFCGNFFVDTPLVSFTFKTLSLTGNMIAKIRAALVDLEAFESNRALRAFMTRRPLDTFKNSVSEGDSPRERADFFISFAVNKAYVANEEWWGGMNLLLVFLSELFSMYKHTGEANALTNLFVEFEEMGILSVS